jgi:hypothetical protein
MERTQIEFCTLTMDVPTCFIWIIIFFNGYFEYGGISKLWSYAGTNAEILSIEFIYL